MKQFLALLLATVMSMSLLTGCRRNDNNSSNNNDQNATPPTNEETVPPQTTPSEDEAENGKPETDNANPDSSIGGMTLKAESTLEDIVMKLGEEMGISMPTKLDDASLKETFGIEPEWIEEYYGEFSAANTSADHLLAFKAKEDHIEDVKKALEARRDAIAKGFEASLTEEMDKARNATIVEKGPYLFFVIAGDANADMDKEVNRAQEIIDSYFE